MYRPLCCREETTRNKFAVFLLWKDSLSHTTTKCPLPRSSMKGTSSRVRQIGPKTLTSNAAYLHKREVKSVH